MTTQSTSSAADKADRARHHPALKVLAKVGTAVYGLMYVVVGWLALQVALGDPSGKASGEGALKEIAQQPMGQVVLWCAVIGFAALVIWSGFEAAVGHRDREGKKRMASRAASGGRAAVFAMLAVLAVQTLTGSSGGGGSKAEEGYTAKVLQLPFGPALVLLVGVGLVGYGGYSAYRGLSDKWKRDLESDGHTGDLGTAITALARIGFTARGVAFVAIGGLVIWAGATHDADKSGGLDQALLTLREAPFGRALLVGVAVGLICFGVYNLAKAWYLRRR